jgi:hypothetical protein
VAEECGNQLMECMMAATPITALHVDIWDRLRHGKIYGQEITKSGFKQCKHCGKAKAKQLPVEKDNQEHIVAGPEEH